MDVSILPIDFVVCACERLLQNTELIYHGVSI